MLGMFEGGLRFHIDRPDDVEEINLSGKRFARLEVLEQQGDQFSGTLSTATGLTLAPVSGFISPKRKVFFHARMVDQQGQVTHQLEAWGKLDRRARRFSGRWTDTNGLRGPIHLRQR
jgi:hypothetical protein